MYYTVRVAAHPKPIKLRLLDYHYCPGYRSKTTTETTIEFGYSQIVEWFNTSNVIWRTWSVPVSPTPAGETASLEAPSRG